MHSMLHPDGATAHTAHAYARVLRRKSCNNLLFKKIVFVLPLLLMSVGAQLGGVDSQSDCEDNPSAGCPGLVNLWSDSTRYHLFSFPSTHKKSVELNIIAASVLLEFIYSSRISQWRKPRIRLQQAWLPWCMHLHKWYASHGSPCRACPPSIIILLAAVTDRHNIALHCINIAPLYLHTAASYLYRFIANTTAIKLCISSRQN